MELTCGSVRVVFEYLGEGLSGDYDESDPDDVAFLRFTIYKRTGHSGEDWIDWEAIEDASYCTQIRTDTPAETLSLLIARIFNEVYGKVEAGQSIKKVCELLSWLHADDADPHAK
jgi:hypothetical protein